jgi:phage tail sheath protein FI
MPVQLSYPGVYIQEIPSQVRSITGVATSITAFVGTAASGPVGVATLIHSQPDYDRIFGGLAVDSPMSFCVRDFFLNGGSSAVILRLYHPGASNSTSVLSIVDHAHGATLFNLVAASPGSWGVNIRVALDNNTSADAAKALGPTLTQKDVFNLTVTNKATGAVEMFRNVTFLDSARRIDIVLQNGSQLAQWPPAAATKYCTFTAAALPSTTINTAVKAEFAIAPPGTPPALYDAIGWDEAFPKNPTAIADLAPDTAAASAPQSQPLTVVDDFFPSTATTLNKQALYALEDADLFNILVIPPYKAASNPLYTDGDVEPDVLAPALAYCLKRRAILLVDPPDAWTSKKPSDADLQTWIGTLDSDSKRSAAIFFPRLVYTNPFHSNQLEPFVPSGALAGIFARTDTERGVWKAPAGLDAGIAGTSALSYNLTDLENGDLNPLGLNCLRTFAGAGRVVWGSRTLQGDDRLASQWKYISVRRTALFLEESIFRGTQWVVFEPNDEPLWAQIRLNVGAFMQQLFLQGAFQGQTQAEAYFVKCDHETTTQNDINNGIVNVIVGFAPLKPAEFVVISLQQMAGQVQV